MPADVISGGTARGGAGRLARRVLAALPLSALLLALVALPASAHAVGGASPTNYDTRILSISPQVPGVSIRVVEAGARLELVNTSGQDVIVPGYGGEPYLKVGPGGIEENTRSPATYVNQSVDASVKAPPEADPAAAPVWRHVGGGNRVAWHDHRTHWMVPTPPPAVRQNPGREHLINPEWRIDFQHAGGQPIVVKGDLRWVPGPSATPWLVGAAILALVLLLASRTPAWAPVLGGAVVLLILVDVIHTAGVWSGTASSVPVKLYSSIVPVAGWLVGILAVMRLRAGQRESGVFFALFAAALALVSALGDLAALSSSQLVGSLPEWATRLAVAARIGLAAGIAVAGLIAMRRSAMTKRPEPSGGGATVAAGMLIVAMLAGGLLLAAAQPASAHGSEVLLKATATMAPARPGSVRVVAVATYLDGDRAGGLTVRAVASDGSHRVAFALRPAGQRGVYAGVHALRPGLWTIRVTASGKAKGQTTVRITVPGPQAPPTTAAPLTATTTTIAATTTSTPDTTEPAVEEDTTTASEPDDTTFAAAPTGASDDGGGGRTAAIVASLAIGGLAALATGGFLMRRSRRP